MPLATWPPGLPQMPLVGFNRTPNSPVTRMAVDKGPERIRRDGLKPRIFQRTKMELNGDQVETFLDFYQNTLLAGTQRFTWIDFLTRQSATVKFTKEPTWDNDSPAVDYEDAIYVGDLEMEVFI